MFYRFRFRDVECAYPYVSVLARCDPDRVVGAVLHVEVVAVDRQRPRRLPSRLVEARLDPEYFVGYNDG